jgi:hypothetical protein
MRVGREATEEMRAQGVRAKGVKRTNRGEQYWQRLRKDGRQREKRSRSLSGYWSNETPE